MYTCNLALQYNFRFLNMMLLPGLHILYIGKMWSLDTVQNRFLSFAGYRLNITHPPHKYRLISKLFNIKLLIEYCNISSYRFICD